MNADAWLDMCRLHPSCWKSLLKQLLGQLVEDQREVAAIAAAFDPEDTCIADLVSAQRNHDCLP